MLAFCAALSGYKPGISSSHSDVVYFLRVRRQAGRQGDRIHVVDVVVQPASDLLRLEGLACLQINRMIVVRQSVTGFRRLLLTLLTSGQVLPRRGLGGSRLRHLLLQLGHVRALRTLLFTGRQFLASLGGLLPSRRGGLMGAACRAGELA